MNIRTKVLHVTDAKDPDEFIKKKGAQGFARLLGKSENSMMYQVGELKKQYDLGNLEEKIEFLNELARLFAKVSNPIEREILVREAAAESGVSEDAIFARFEKISIILKKIEIMRLKERKTGSLSKNRVQHKDIQTELYEGMLANLICTDKQVYLAVRERADIDFFKTPARTVLCRRFTSSGTAGKFRICR